MDRSFRSKCIRGRYGGGAVGGEGGGYEYAGEGDGDGRGEDERVGWADLVQERCDKPGEPHGADGAERYADQGSGHSAPDVLSEGELEVADNRQAEHFPIVGAAT